jgi:hypothetical protein
MSEGLTSMCTFEQSFGIIAILAQGEQRKGLMTVVVLMLLFVSASPVLADARQAKRAEPTITCETVRAYVSQVGLAAAKAIARANGMTPVQERRARQCLASRD